VRSFVEDTPVFDLPDSYWSDERRGFRALLNV
jgi:hypothetical protein